ncbi:MAG: hypothetical protein HZA88_11480 [Verrucomicrobia bacterium]|nr:hypothetical protein [Verrucomicrobiota bacterium]
MKRYIEADEYWYFSDANRAVPPCRPPYLPIQSDAVAQEKMAAEKKSV